MSGALGFLSFGLGAALSTAALRALREGSQPDPRAALKDGIRLWKTIADAAGAAQTEFDAFQAEMRTATERPGSAGETRRRITLEPPGCGVAPRNT